jgi:hypothetical protein
VSQQRDTASTVIDRPARQRDVLASDADREAVAGMLSSAFAEGRLTADEHAGRVQGAYGARTLGELGKLTADLPDPGDEVRKQQAVLVPEGVDRCLLCALLICCPPAGIAWLLAARRRMLRAGGAGATDR